MERSTIPTRAAFGPAKPTRRSAVRQSGAKIGDVFGDDLLARRDLLAAQRERLLGDRLQRIDIVKINAIHFIHLGRDIARHRDIDDEKRPIQRSRTIGDKISGVSSGSSADVDEIKMSISRH